MPIECSGFSRRQFLTTSAMGVVGLSAWAGANEEQLSDTSIALLSDTHLPGDAAFSRHGVNMAENFRRVSREVLDSADRPSRVLINGDCAYLTGEAEDYQTLVELLKPLREAGRSITMGLGNHDDREHFFAASLEASPDRSLVKNRHASVVETPTVNWFMLDSLRNVGETIGAIGEEQLEWLDRALGKATNKPAFVMAHHNVEHHKHLKDGKTVVDVAGRRLPVPGVVDDERLIEILFSHPHASAFFCGHTHQFNIVEREGVSFVNLPCVAYTFAPEDPNGWVICRQQGNGAELELRCLDTSHRYHGQKTMLPYRGS